MILGTRSAVADAGKGNTWGAASSAFSMLLLFLLAILAVGRLRKLMQFLKRSDEHTRPVENG